MFAVLEKDNELQAVHSLSDLKYLMARGWQQQVKEPVKEPEPLLEAKPKKRGRPFKKD